MDRSGATIDLTSHDFPPRHQQETDHLDGVLFFDRMRTFETLAFSRRIRALLAKDRD